VICARKKPVSGVLTSIEPPIISPLKMRFVLTLCLLLAIAACGAKGPLYLPDAKAPQKQSK
jgi:hypothetical protein